MGARKYLYEEDNSFSVQLYHQRKELFCWQVSTILYNKIERKAGKQLDT